MKISGALGLGQRRERRHFQCCLCSLSSAPSCLAVHWYLVHGAQLSGSSNLPQLGRVAQKLPSCLGAGGEAAAIPGCVNTKQGAGILPSVGARLGVKALNLQHGLSR